MKEILFTICSANYLAYANTLCKSYREAGGTGEFYIFLADRIDGRFDPSRLATTVVEAHTLGFPAHDDMAFRYTIMEFNTAIKPFCIKYLFGECGADAAIYLDPDIFVLKPLDHVMALLQDGADIVLTPHLTAPLHDGCHPDEMTILQTGAYNLGFGAFRNTPDTNRFVDWWRARLETDCIVDLENGLFVDQKFLDFAPSYVPGTRLLHHPGYNAAYWNLAHRDITQRDGTWYANDEKLHFFHFSGVTPPSRQVFSKHQDRFTVSQIGALNGLLGTYIDRLVAEGHEDWKKVPYVHHAFDDGSPIPDVLRRLYRRKAGGRRLPTTEPFRRDLNLALAPAGEVRQLTSVPITNIMYQIWLERPDLQAVFGLTTRSGQDGLVNWYYDGARRELDLPDDLFPAIGQAGPDGTGLPVARGPLSLRAKKWAARQVFGNLDTIRPLYKKIPEHVRAPIREALLRIQGQGGADAYTITASAQGPERAAAARDASVLVSGYLRAATGVGEGARRCVCGLQAAGIDVATRTIPLPSADHDRLAWHDLTLNGRDPAIAITHVNADQMLHLGRWLDPALIAGRYHIGYWAWELPEFPDEWTPALDAVHEIWVPSRFVADALRARTDKPVTVIPHSVGLPQTAEPVPDRAAIRARFALPEDAFLFLTAFDANSYLSRKNPLGALEAFRKAFPADADGRRSAMLVVKMHGAGRHPGTRRDLVSAIRDDASIVLIDEVLPDNVMAGLQDACDAFVSLHRAEGFGLHLAEMMLRGKPVVATAWSGNLDFMDEDCAALVGYDLVDLQEGDYPFWEGRQWAEPDIDAAAVQLRRLVDEPAWCAQLGDAARARIGEQLSRNAVGRLMRARLAGISAAFAEREAPSPAPVSEPVAGN